MEGLGSGRFMGLKSIEGSCHSGQSSTTENWRIQNNGMNWMLWRILCGSLDILGEHPSDPGKREKKSCVCKHKFVLSLPLGGIPLPTYLLGLWALPHPAAHSPLILSLQGMCSEADTLPCYPSSAIWYLGKFTAKTMLVALLALFCASSNLVMLL